MVAVLFFLLLQIGCWGRGLVKKAPSQFEETLKKRKKEEKSGAPLSLRVSATMEVYRFLAEMVSE